MLLVRIHDFRSQPGWFEYCIFYCSTALTTYVIGLALLSKIPSIYGWLAFIMLSSVTYIFSVIKRTRDIQAIQFFHACIAHYTIAELQQILPRFSNGSPERAIVLRRIQYLQGVDLTPSRSHTCATQSISMG